MTEPLISVIVTAYNRKQYLPRALNSIHEQELPAAEFEVVISKNFHDETADGLATAWGYRLLEASKVTAGAQVKSALEFCRGSIVALLDDDDTWLPSRLSHVAASFEARPNLQYYANTHRPINEAGATDYGQGRKSVIYYRRISDGSVHPMDPRTLDFAAIDQLQRTNPGNNSSIAVSRELLEKYREHVGRIRTSIDHFLLAAALLGDGPMVFEHLPLTVWQRHAANTSRIDTQSFPGFRVQFQEVVERIRADNRVMLEMARGGTRPALTHFLEEKIAALDEMEAILQRAGTRGQAARAGLDALRESLQPGLHGYWGSARNRARFARALSQSFAEVALYLYLEKELRG
jgi:glycosyltransferase involved in cell wall biosynthesis